VGHKKGIVMIPKKSPENCCFFQFCKIHFQGIYIYHSSFINRKSFPLSLFAIEKV